MHAVGQSEIVILLQCLPDEKCLPKDIFNHFVQLYRDALAGRNPYDLIPFIGDKTFRHKCKIIVLNLEAWRWMLILVAS